MSMYVLQVMTGAEPAVRDALLDKGIPAYAPEENRWIRSGGAWALRRTLLFRGYVFLVSRDVLHDYYTVKRLPGVLRWLELHAGKAAALQSDEEALIHEISQRVLESHVTFDGKVFTPLDGPLKTYADNGCKILYNRHHRRAYVFEPLSVMRSGCLKLSFTLTQ